MSVFPIKRSYIGKVIREKYKLNCHRFKGVRKRLSDQPLSDRTWKITLKTEIEPSGLKQVNTFRDYST